MEDSAEAKKIRSRENGSLVVLMVLTTSWASM
jgi:hypothetical protein